jgi:hypothetical protein
MKWKIAFLLVIVPHFYRLDCSNKTGVYAISWLKTSAMHLNLQ